jgi:hypothetical protein
VKNLSGKEKEVEAADVRAPLLCISPLHQKKKKKRKRKEKKRSGLGYPGLQVAWMNLDKNLCVQ